MQAIRTDGREILQKPVIFCFNVFEFSKHSERNSKILFVPTKTKQNGLHFVDSHCFIFSGEHDKTLEALRVAQI